MSKILLHEPYFFSDEIKNLSNCIKTGWVSTGGNFVKKFEENLVNYTNSKYSVALNSGTTALDLSLKAISAKAKDEIIVPTITFIAPINAVLYNGCNPVFMDCDSYGNIDLVKVKEFIINNTIFKNGISINKRTKKRIAAIIVVHIFGNTVDLTSIINLCKKRNIKIIEDASESLGSFLIKRNKRLHSGTSGDIGCISFNANKILTTGAGGAVVTNNINYFKKISYLSTQAKDDAIRFIHGDIGFNAKLSNVSASIGVAQFKTFKKILNKKKKINKFYNDKINNLKNFYILQNPSHSESNYWLNLLKLKNCNNKFLEKVMKILLDNGIQVRPVWYPNHMQKKMKNFQKYKLNKYKNYYNSTLCLPSGYNLTKKNLFKITELLSKIDRDES
jgi:perosamine synthetase